MSEADVRSAPSIPALGVLVRRISVISIAY
jgi:hypothetical protein